MTEQRRSIDDRAHRQWLDDETQRLLDFGRHVVRDGGGAFSLDDHGEPRRDQPVETWITARMVHVYGLGKLLGRPDAEAIATGSLSGLLGLLADEEHGGWHTAVDAAGAPVSDEKSCYAHAFVLLASSTAVAAGLPRAEALFERAQDVLLQRFWDDDAGMCVDLRSNPANCGGRGPGSPFA